MLFAKNFHSTVQYTLSCIIASSIVQKLPFVQQFLAAEKCE